MALLVSMGTARNHICAADPCPLCAPEPRPRARSYRCPVCDVYGKGLGCWSCGSVDVYWNQIPSSGEKP